MSLTRLQATIVLSSGECLEDEFARLQQLYRGGLISKVDKHEHAPLAAHALHALHQTGTIEDSDDVQAATRTVACYDFHEKLRYVDHIRGKAGRGDESAKTQLLTLINEARTFADVPPLGDTAHPIFGEIVSTLHSGRPAREDLLLREV